MRSSSSYVSVRFVGCSGEKLRGDLLKIESERSYVGVGKIFVAGHVGGGNAEFDDLGQAVSLEISPVCGDIQQRPLGKDGWNAVKAVSPLMTSGAVGVMTGGTFLFE